MIEFWDRILAPDKMDPIKNHEGRQILTVASRTHLRQCRLRLLNFSLATHPGGLPRATKQSRAKILSPQFSKILLSV